MNRLIALQFLLIAAATAAALGYVFTSTRWLIRDQVRQVAAAELDGFLDDYRAQGVFGLAQAIQRRLDAERGGDGVYLLADARGRRLAGNLTAWPPEARPAADGFGAWATVERIPLNRRSPAVIEARAVRLPGGELLLVGRDAAARRLFQATLWRALTIAVVGLFAATLAAGLLLSRLLRGRLDAIAATATEIMSGDLAPRAPRGAAGDEFDVLADRLNAMLDRIATLVADLRLATDSVAHDLRSPLARLRGHLEAALERVTTAERPDAGAQALIEAALQEADAALRIFASLTAIARADAGVGRDQFEPVDLGELVFELAGLYEPAAEAKGLRLDIAAAQGLVAPGHRQLLAQAASNLIENALRHGPQGTTLRLVVEPDRLNGSPAARIAVLDQGPGIPPEDRTRVLRRFEQLDPSRGGGGSGLGLALAAAVATLHQGAVTLEDAEPGRAPPGLAASLTVPL